MVGAAYFQFLASPNFVNCFTSFTRFSLFSRKLVSKELNSVPALSHLVLLLVSSYFNCFSS